MCRTHKSNRKYIVRLSAQERGQLKKLVSTGNAAAHRITRARILMLADEGPEGRAWIDEDVAQAVDVTVRTVENIRKRFVNEGLEAAVNRKRQVRPSRARLLDGRQEAKLVALCCSAPPEGRSRWTLRLLADQIVALEIVDSISHETVRQTLKKRAEALAEKDVVHSASRECPVRVRDGERPGGLPPAARSEATADLYG